MAPELHRVTNSMAEGDGLPSRNFRSAYYEKLGFCGNDENNYLDMLLASSPLDLEKLSDLCERFEVDRRCVEAWKILLGKFNKDHVLKENIYT